MSLPDSRNRTYVDGVTEIPDVDMNTLQDDDIRLHSMAIGSNLVIYDDFMGGHDGGGGLAFDDTRGLWVDPTAVSSVPDSVLIADLGNGGMGVAGLNAVTQTQKLYSTTMDMGTVDFRVFARARLQSFGTGARAAIGLDSDGATTDICEFIAEAGGNWLAYTDANDPGFDTGIAINTTYKNFLIRKTGSTVYFYINGALVRSEAFTSDIGEAYLKLQAIYDSPGNYVYMYVDSVKLWIDR